MLAKNLVLHCGSGSITWQELVQLEQIILRWRLHSLLIGEDHDIKTVFKAMNVLGNFRFCQAKMAELTDNIVRIPLLVHVTRRKAVTMPLDRVYGVLGLVSLPIRDGVEVGYQADVSEVYASFIKRPLVGDHELQLPGQVAGPRARSSPGLPSYCADLRPDAPINQFGGRNGIASGYQAGFKPPSTEQALLLPSSSADTLRLRGWLVDVVVDKVEGHELSGLMSQHEAAIWTLGKIVPLSLGRKQSEELSKRSCLRSAEC